MRGFNASDTAYHEHVHDVGDHDAAEEAFPIVDDDMEDGFVDGWEDEDSEDEDLAEIVVGADGRYSGHFLLLVVGHQHWFLPTSTNTVYNVRFYIVKQIFLGFRVNESWPVRKTSCQ